MYGMPSIYRYSVGVIANDGVLHSDSAAKGATLPCCCCSPLLLLFSPAIVVLHSDSAAKGATLPCRCCSFTRGIGYYCVVVLLYVGHHSPAVVVFYTWPTEYSSTPSIRCSLHPALHNNNNRCSAQQQKPAQQQQVLTSSSSARNVAYPFSSSRYTGHPMCEGL